MAKQSEVQNSKLCLRAGVVGGRNDSRKSIGNVPYLNRRACRAAEGDKSSKKI